MFKTNGGTTLEKTGLICDQNLIKISTKLDKNLINIGQQFGQNWT